MGAHIGGSRRRRRICRRPIPPSVPRRRKRRDNRKMVEGRDGGEVDRDFSRIVPEVNWR